MIKIAQLRGRNSGRRRGPDRRVIKLDQASWLQFLKHRWDVPPMREAPMSTVAAVSPYGRFAAVFREEHRIVRDLLFDLLDAYELGDSTRARKVLSEVARITGPHFRYEEEALYPALVPVFGPEYIEKLLGDHDFAIASARRLVELTDGHGL